MPSYIPERIYSFTGRDERGRPTYGLVPWPEHLKPHAERKGAPVQQPAHDAAAGPEGAVFLTVDHRDRIGIATTIERLIDMLDALDDDPDMEDDGDAETWLGWPEHFAGRGAHGLGKTFDTYDANNGGEHVGEYDLERDASDFEDGGDDELTLGAPERHPAFWGLVWDGPLPAASGSLRYCGSGDQRRWARGVNVARTDECEVENEHGGDVLDAPHDAEADEPSLGWSEEVDQERRIDAADECALVYDGELDGTGVCTPAGILFNPVAGARFDGSGNGIARDALRRVPAAALQHPNLTVIHLSALPR